MFADRTQHYRALASRLRKLAAGSRFGEVRNSCLKLADQFERLADSAERTGCAMAGAAMSGEDD